MDFITCGVSGLEGQPNIDVLLNDMKVRIEGEEHHRNLCASEFEKSDRTLKRFLEVYFLDLEVALGQWNRWVRWRHDAGIDEITEDQIANERKEGIIVWRGKNKQGMLCCVITGRMLDPLNRKGTFMSFRKHILKVAEEGLRAADEMENQKICIIYDRRGLDYQHIDPNLYQFVRREIESLKEWYSDRIGQVYILQSNMIFWVLYHFFMRPILSLWNNHNKLIIVEKAEELLQFFDEDQLLLLSPEVSAGTAKVTVEGNASMEEGNPSAAVLRNFVSSSLPQPASTTASVIEESNGEEVVQTSQPYL